MNPYNFYQADWPSIDDVRTRLEKDQELPSKERGVLLANLDWILWLAAGHERFKGWHIGNLPFAGAVFDGILRDTGEMPDPVEVRSNRAGLDSVLVRYRLTTKLEAASIALEWLALYQQVAGHRARDLKRFLMFLSSNQVKPNDVTAALSEGYRDAIMRDPTVKHWNRAWIQALRDWNWATMRIEGWPKLQFDVPVVREKPKGLPWSAYPPGLQDQVKRYLTREPGLLKDDPDVVAAFAVDPEGLKHGVNLVRICLGALVRSGIAPESIVCARDFVAPDRFSRIARQLFKDAGNKATPLVRTKLARLLAVATRCGELTEDEIKKVKKTCKSYSDDSEEFRVANPSYLEVASQKLSAEEELAKMRDFVIEMYASPPPKRVGRDVAMRMKQAAMLGLRVETALTTVIIRRLALEDHFVELSGELEGCLELIVQKSETANRMRRNGILSKEISQVLRDFHRYYRGFFIKKGDSKYLFPGPGSKPLGASTISNQQSRFLGRYFGEDFKPSLIRALTRDMILEADPEATGVVSEVLGISDMVYVQKLAEPYLGDQANTESVRLERDGEDKSDSDSEGDDE